MAQDPSVRVRPGSVHYELDVRAFTPEGSLPAAAAHLDHLLGLGVDVVELAPGPAEAESGLAAFVDACHAKGMAVVLGLSAPVTLADLRPVFTGYRFDGVRAPGFDAEFAVGAARLAAEVGRPLALLPTENGHGGEHALHALLTGDVAGVPLGSSETLADVLHEALLHAGSLSRGGHRALAAHHFVGTPHPAGTDQALLRVGATLLFTGPFTPLVFMGEEWGAPAPRSQELAIAASSRSGHRRAPSPTSTRRGALDWSEPTRPGHAELLDCYRQVIGVRRSTPDLADPRLDRVQLRCGDQFLAMRRGGCEVVANLASTSRRVSLDQYPRRVLFATERGTRLTRDAVELPPHSAIIVSYT